MKKITIPTYLLWILSILIFIISILKNPYGTTYLTAVCFIFLLSALIFNLGMIINKKETYKRNINIYIFLYLFLLILLTIFINRPKISLINKEFLEIYTTQVNIIPFKTIINYLIGPSNSYHKIINILGNLIALTPLSLLLILKNKKYENLKYQLIHIGLIVLFIELLQLITMTGHFDIDDFILNILGVILFTFVLKKLKLIEKIKVLFYNDFNLHKILKYGIQIFLIATVLLFNIITIIDMVSIEKIVKQTFYVEEKDSCNALEKVEMNNYNLYLDCVRVIYEAEDGKQYSIEEALKEQKLTRKLIKENLKKVETLWDGGTTTYVNKKENIAFILCQTVDGNNDIYVGNKSLRYQEQFCK